jgi:RES domain
MEQEISQKALPYNKQLQYISTQVVAEYLKEYFSCEAVIYRSSVVREHGTGTRNIVILPRAENFVGGDAAVLKYQNFTVKTVLDVTYELATPSIPF